MECGFEDLVLGTLVSATQSDLLMNCLFQGEAPRDDMFKSQGWGRTGAQVLCDVIWVLYPHQAEP